ncbi:MAG: hypothetical protein HKN25_05935 [Pyrinomonadaceae bacterium]|nr:hypothetical protein [Pyrinomonadaceae bacterium]
MLIASLLVNFGLAVLIWTVQLVIYPSFFEVEAKRFADWHNTYTTRISFLVLPLMVLQVVFFGLRLIEGGPQAITISQSVLVAFVWAMTFFASVPCHNRLSVKKDEIQIKRLVSTNWPRTAAWSTVVILDWYLIFRQAAIT